jgi:hypothetical protein
MHYRRHGWGGFVQRRLASHQLENGGLDLPWMVYHVAVRGNNLWLLDGVHCQCTPLDRHVAELKY